MHWKVKGTIKTVITQCTCICTLSFQCSVFCTDIFLSDFSPHVVSYQGTIVVCTVYILHDSVIFSKFSMCTVYCTVRLYKENHVLKTAIIVEFLLINSFV